MKLRWALLGVALAGCASTRALCPEEGGAPWREVRSAHFTVQTNLDSGGAQRAAVDLERFESGLLSLLWPRPEALPTGRLEVIVLRNPLQLSEFAGPSIAGYFTEAEDQRRVVLAAKPYLAGDFRLDLPVVAHELTHALSSFALGREPRWLAEGFATYLETARVIPEDGTVEVGGLPAENLAIAQRHRLPVKELWAWSREAADRIEVAEFYSTSWLLVHALINHHPEELADFLRLLGAGEDPRDAWLSSIGPRTREHLDDELTAYVAHGEYALIRVKTGAIDATVTERALSPTEVHLVRAWLFESAPIGGPDDAHAKALAEVIEGLRHQPAEADATFARDALEPEQASLARATARTVQFPRDFRAWAELGDAGQPEAYEKAHQLAPDDAPTTVKLARALGKAHDLPRALSLAREAAAAEPFSVRALLAWAEASAALGLCDEAITAQARALERLTDEVPAKVRKRLVDRLEALEEVCGRAPATER